MRGDHPGPFRTGGTGKGTRSRGERPRGESERAPKNHRDSSRLF